jgi:phytoene synthase
MAKALEEEREVVRENLSRLSEAFFHGGLPRAALDGKLLRPLAAYLIVPESRRRDLDDRFWWGTLAVEMVHEASLLHDDILDEAPERRGRPTFAASAGIGPALILGDHLLTAAYRAALAAESADFLRVFVQAVERTVAGEIAQDRAQGRIIEEGVYRSTITGKSGELFRAVFSLPPFLLGVGSPEAVGALGARLGCLYQMVDDFLDYCPDADRGKIPLQDYRQKKWTWPLGLIGATGFGLPQTEVLSRLFRPEAPGGTAPMERGARRLGEERGALLSALEAEGLGTDRLADLTDGWTRQVARATALDVRRFSARPHSWGTSATARESRSFLLDSAAGLSTAEARLCYFGAHAKTFRFAARLFPKGALQKVAGVYAFCRFTDDLVDEASTQDPEILEARLGTWLDLARSAYEGGASGVPLLDEVLTTAREAQVPFSYVEALIEGVRMDIRPRTYENLEALRGYSYRVASAVGGWLTELFGIHDPWVLERAFALGHAMQLTNILRDVGEDLSAGRLYLPLDRMNQCGLNRDLLRAKARGGSALFPGYPKLIEDLMAQADEDYRRAFEAIPSLPAFFQGPVAVAARAYQGIHEEIRRNRYDNLTRRARTSRLRKIRIGSRALLDLFILRRRLGGTAEGLGRRGVPVDEGQEVTA